MMRFGRFVSIVVSSLTLFLSSVAHAQRFVALAGGTNVGRGPALEYQALLWRKPVSPQLGWRRNGVTAYRPSWEGVYRMMTGVRQADFKTLERAGRGRDRTRDEESRVR